MGRPFYVIVAQTPELFCHWHSNFTVWAHKMLCVQFIMSNSGSFSFLHECTFISTACSLTVNVKLMLQLQHVDFDTSDAVVKLMLQLQHVDLDTSDAVVPVLFTQSHMLFERIQQL
jgi:hypothetical protein